MTSNEQYDIVLFFRSGLPFIMAWILLIILAIVYSMLGVLFDSRKEKKIEETNKGRKDEQVRIDISVKHANKYMATMFITAWLILSFIIYRWIF